jgi:glycosyltransferase involved in cell wall biosynthesis
MSLKVAMAAFAHPDAPSGYGVIGVKIHEYLALAGAEVMPGTDFGWDCIVAISLPAAWPFEGGRKREDIVFHTMFEVSPLPPQWVPVLNRCGLVWVPAQSSANLLREAGVTAPIMVSGYGVDPQVFFSTERRDHADKPYTFLIFGSALIGRKNILRGINAFVNAGLPVDEAQLIVKLNAGMSASYVQDEHGKPYPNIRIIAEDWRYPSQLADLFREADCGISLSAGEGFGLQPLEMMATGLPVILHHCTGVLDYANAYNTIPVGTAGKERTPEYEKRFGPTLYWQAVPDLTQATDLIKWAFYNRAAAAKIGAQAAADVAEHWTWAQAGVRALKLLEAHYLESANAA